jgi:mRNA interferase MazF
MASEPLDFGDVVLVRFPFINKVSSKQRPAVVVSSRSYQIFRPDLVIMAITSQLRDMAGFGEVWIEDWQRASRLKPSAVKPVFATIEQSLVSKSLGRLQTADLVRLRKTVSVILGS